MSPEASTASTPSVRSVTLSRFNVAYHPLSSRMRLPNGGKSGSTFSSRSAVLQLLLDVLGEELAMSVVAGVDRAFGMLPLRVDPKGFDDLVAELRADAAQPQHNIPPIPMVDELSAFDHYTPASRKMIENMASSTMTQKMDSTTDLVVSCPTLSALPLTWSPSKQPIVAITMPKTGALIMPV